MTGQPPSPPRAPHRRDRGLLWWLGWPVRQLLIVLLLAYRRYVSPLLPPSCRYHPSCSTYALRALRRHGAVKGTLLSSWRVLRCNPWSGGGVDPVPRRGRWLPDVYPDGSRRPGHG